MFGHIVQLNTKINFNNFYGFLERIMLASHTRAGFTGRYGCSLKPIVEGQDYPFDPTTNSTHMPQTQILIAGKKEFTYRWRTLSAPNEIRFFFGEATEAAYNTKKTKYINAFHTNGDISEKTLSAVLDFLFDYDWIANINLKENSMLEDSIFNNQMKALMVTELCTADIKAENYDDLYKPWVDMLQTEGYDNTEDDSQGDADRATQKNFIDELKRRVHKVRNDHPYKLGIEKQTFTATDAYNVDRQNSTDYGPPHYFMFDVPLRPSDNHSYMHLFPEYKKAFLTATTIV
jgi:hypothetical protein